jgi:hypothetical protein
MIQKSVCLFFLSLILFQKVKSQEETKRTICCCSNTIEQLSNGWKKDLQTSGNYRLINNKFLFTCKIDSVSTEYVLNKLGKPESIGANNNEVDYLYYFFDKNSISKKDLEEIIGIRLRFNKDKNQLVSTELILNDF